MTTRPVKLRPVAEDDSKLIWELRNEPSTRAASFTSDLIPYEDHRLWFSQRSTNPNSKMFVILNSDGEEIGYVRFEIRDGEGYISISIDKKQRRKGYGVSAIKTASAQILSSAPVRRIIALVRHDNEASRAVFARAGFVPTGSTIISNVVAEIMEYLPSKA